jgi:hypothetical protein
MGLNLLARASAFLQQTDRKDDQFSLLDTAQRLATDLIQADDKEGIKRALDGAMGDVVQGLVASLVQTQKPKEKEKEEEKTPAATAPASSTPRSQDPRFNSTIVSERRQNALSLQAPQSAPVANAPAPVANAPVANQPAPVVTTVPTPVANAPVANAPVANEVKPALPAVNEPAPVANAPVANEVKPALPAVNEPTPIANAPVANAPIANAPVANAPIANAPVANAPVANAPVANAPVANAPVANAPVANAPVVNEVKPALPTVNEPAPVANAPVANAPVANAPVANAPVVNAPVVNEVKPALSAVNEPAPVANAPVANAPVANAPVANAPVANAPVANAPAVNQAAINQAAQLSTETANAAAVNEPVANAASPVANAAAPVVNEAKPTAQAVAAVANEPKPEAINQAANQVNAANEQVREQVNQAQAVNSQVNEAVLQAANQVAPAAPAAPAPLQAPPGTDPVAWQQWLAWQQIRTTFRKQKALNQDAATAEMSAQQGEQALEAAGAANAPQQQGQTPAGGDAGGVQAAAPTQTTEATPTAQEVQPTPVASPDARPNLAALEKFIGKANVDGMTHINEGLEWNMNKGVWYAHSYNAYMNKNGKQMPHHYWKGYASDKYFENHGFYKFQLLPNKSASEAIDAFFTGLTVCECYSAIMAIQYRTLMQTMGREKFDEVFGSKDKPVKRTMMIEAQPSKENPISALSDFTQAAKTGNEGKFGQRPAKPGEWYYFYNHPKYLLKHPAGAFQGENALCMGENEHGEQTWRGYGVNEVTEQEMLEEMANAHNSSRTEQDKARIKDMADKGFDVSIFEKTNFPDQIKWEDILSAPAFTYGGTTRKGGFMVRAGQDLNADLIAQLMGSLGIDIGGKKLRKDNEQGQS